MQGSKATPDCCCHPRSGGDPSPSGYSIAKALGSRLRGNDERRMARVLRLALLGLACLAGSALADWKQDYARGVEAAGDGRWGDTARYMQGALAGNATPEKRVRLYGQRYEVYVPQHYAGLAAWRQGDCASALRYWSQGGNPSFIQGFPDLASVEQEGKAACSSSSQVATTEKPPVVTPPVENRTDTRPSEVKPPPPPPPPVVEQTVQLSRDALILKPLIDAYLSGRYADVIKLSAKVPPTPRLRWHMLTLRAAAAFTMAESGADEGAGQIARSAVADARAADATLKPDPNYFSPRFIAFYSGR